MEHELAATVLCALCVQRPCDHPQPTAGRPVLTFARLAAADAAAQVDLNIAVLLACAYRHSEQGARAPAAVSCMQPARARALACRAYQDVHASGGRWQTALHKDRGACERHALRVTPPRPTVPLPLTCQVQQATPHTPLSRFNSVNAVSSCSPLSTKALDWEEPSCSLLSQRITSS